MAENSKPIHPDLLFANCIRVKAKIAFALSTAFMEEHKATGITFADLAMRLEKDVDQVRRMFTPRDRAIGMMADLSLALNVEPEFGLAPRRLLETGDAAEVEPTS